MHRILGIAAVLAWTAGLDAQVGRPQGLVYPNLASEKELLALPHMSPAIVKGVLERRPFLSMADFNKYLGQSLRPAQLQELYARTFVPINLNAASREEILLIPGVGDRMLKEFLEYRPYAGLAVFRAEIGKYVDKAELARLEQYVFVPVKLNNASDEDILTIPGVGSRMLREFKEYRPYDTIDKFRREIGKYVDKNEVARLERYVTLR